MDAQCKVEITCIKTIKHRKTLRMKLAIVLGTRHEIIKFSPIIRECTRVSQDFFVLHTGQHYSYNMAKIFFKQFELPEAKHNLDVGSGTHAEQTGKMIIDIERVLLEEKPDVVLVQGDTNTSLAGALAAVKLGIKVGHVEAGLRSYDRQMPEEINRILADHCSDLLFAPTLKSKQTLLNEGILESKVFVTGNTIVDAVYQNLRISKKRRNAQVLLDLEKKNYILTTIHRQENVDNEQRFTGILRGLELVQKHTGLPIIYPVHPRARKQLETFRIRARGIKMVKPLDYLNFLRVENEARLVLTDSGGVQEEACILGVPCVTLRYNTERPETIEVGANILAGADPIEILKKTQLILNRKKLWKNPFGDGEAGKKIIQTLTKEIPDESNATLTVPFPRLFSAMKNYLGPERCQMHGHRSSSSAHYSHA
jgi:UDP-N-acetylglucosamine 2-epimerase (non-hydrolysing)